MYDTERRRLLLAIVVTLMALPALWWANRDGDTTADDAVQAAAVDTAASTTSTTEPPPSTVGRPNLPPPEPIDRAPVFLDGPTGQVSDVPAIAVPGQPASETVIAEATYRRALAGNNVCISRRLSANRVVTVVNLNNNRAITCILTLGPATQRQDLVMDVDLFEEIADLTDAPIPVEVRL